MLKKLVAAVVYCALSAALTGYAFDPVLVERAKAGALKECEECDFANAELKKVDDPRYYVCPTTHHTWKERHCGQRHHGCPSSPQ